MTLRFTKMQGTGNDFVLIDALSPEIAGVDFSRIASKLCDRKYGIGADQLLLLLPSKKADFRMAIFNPDASQVEMCGNGIRCLARYIWDKGYSKNGTLEIETLAGIRKPERRGELVRVDMGVPRLEASEIPVRLEGRVIDHPLKVKDKTFAMTCVSMGNPHAVIFVDEVENFPVALYGPEIENHQLFPERTNVEFIKVVSRKEIKMRVWERGTGETLACGTGACAAAVAACMKKLTESDVKVKLTGGELIIEWGGEGKRLYMTGPAEYSFTGEIEI